ncbi:MAG: hypothetical protein ABJE95_20880 [Byssovorax sp.]
MLTPRIAAASLALTALLPACGNSAAPTAQPTAQPTASAAPSASAAPPADAVSPLKADLAALVAGCTWTDEGVKYCAAVDAFTKKLAPAGEARAAAIRGCFGLLHDAEVAKAAATCVANFAEKKQVEEILGALEKASLDAVRVELARGVARLHAEDGAPAAHAIQMIRALAPKSSERRIVIHLLTSLSPASEDKDLSPEAYSLAVELFQSPDRAPLHGAAGNLLESSTAHLPEVCKLFAGLVETSKDDWLWAASVLGDHRGCEADLGRVFPTLVKKIAVGADGKWPVEPGDLGRLIGLDGQYPLTAAQKKSLVAAVDALGKPADGEQQKRVIKAIHEHYSK